MYIYACMFIYIYMYICVCIYIDERDVRATLDIYASVCTSEDSEGSLPFVV